MFRKLTTTLALLFAVGATASRIAGQERPPHVDDSPPRLEQRWLEVVSQYLLVQKGADLPRNEGVDMIDAIMNGKMGPGQGWFHPSRSRVGWEWLADRLDSDRDGRITAKEFRGPASLFERLDRDRDQAITADDFDWTSKSKVPAKKGEATKGAGDKGKGGPPLAVLLRGLFQGEIGSPYEGPRVGEQAPLFTLSAHDGSRKVALADSIGKKPVVLIFGSFT